jgi:hypothetical protein
VTPVLYCGMPAQDPPPELEDELLELDELDDELELLDDELLELDELDDDELELLDEELELLDELLDELEELLPSQAPSEVHSSPEPVGPLLVAGLLFCVQ